MSEAAALFRARRLGEPVTVTTATGADLSRLAGAIDSAADMVEFWALLAIRSSSEVVVHAVGWRMLLALPWLSPALVVYDQALGAVRTSTGDQYSLGRPGLLSSTRNCAPSLSALCVAGVSSMCGRSLQRRRGVAGSVIPPGRCRRDSRA
jgi:hypothetical protein